MFFELTYDLDSVNKLFDAFPGAVKDATVAKVTEAVKYLERVIKKNPDFPYGAGPLHLLQTVSSEVSHKGEEVEGIVGTPAKYAEAVEYGTKPHFPPLEPLQYWVEKKLGLPEGEAKSVAYAIALRMAGKVKGKKGGSEGIHMFENTYNEHKADVEKILEEIADEVLKRVG